MPRRLAIVDHPDSQHGRLMALLAVGAGLRRDALVWLTPGRPLLKALTSLTTTHPDVCALAVPQALRPREDSAAWSERVRHTLQQLHASGLPVFKAPDNRGFADVLHGVGWSCRPAADSRPAAFHLGALSHGASGACLLVAARWMLRASSFHTEDVSDQDDAPWPTP